MGGGWFKQDSEVITFIFLETSLLPMSERLGEIRETCLESSCNDQRENLQIVQCLGSEAGQGKQMALIEDVPCARHCSMFFGMITFFILTTLQGGKYYCCPHFTGKKT